MCEAVETETPGAALLAWPHRFFGLHDRVELTRDAIRNGLVEPWTWAGRSGRPPRAPGDLDGGSAGSAAWVFEMEPTPHTS